MNIVFAKHGTTDRYCFYVPDTIKTTIQKGDVLKVQTRYGEKFATAITGVLSGDGSEDVAKFNGATFPLMPVITHVPKELHDFIITEYLHSLLGEKNERSMPF